MAFPGMGGQQGPMDPQEMQAQQMVKLMQSTMESCPGKTVMAGTMGFGMGGLFGLFMASMRYDTPMSSGMPGGVGTVSDLPLKAQLQHGLKDMGRSSWSSAKNFGYIGGVYAGTECVVEGLRAKNDLANGPIAGCATGGWLARSGGPQAMVIGCAGFAAFSGAIDYYMRMPSEDKGADPII